MALSEKARQLVETMTSRKLTAKRAGNVEQFWMSHPVENVQLKQSTVAFIKSMEKPASDLVGARLVNRHAKTVKNLFAVASDIVGKIQKRAEMTALTPEELQGLIMPTVGAPGRPEDGLSDADLRVLEQEIVSGNPAIAPAQASKLFADSYRVISANPGRRITAESDAFGIAPVPMPAVPNKYTPERSDALAGMGLGWDRR